MNSQSFCNSFGMDLVALESSHEKNYFMKSCENNLNFFEAYSHIGAILENNEWSWISSNKKVSFELNLKEKSIKNSTEANCLQLVKSQEEFLFSPVQCFGNDLQQFICQKMIVKDSFWSDLFGK